MRVSEANFAVSASEFRRLTSEEAKQSVPLGCRLIPCPGCGGQALLEPSVTVVRDGVSRTFRPATCRGSCTTEKVRNGRAYLVKKKFELDAEDQAISNRPMPTKEDYPMSLISERKSVQARMDAQRISSFALASELRLDMAELERWLRSGKGLPGKDVARLLLWAASETTHPPAEPAEERSLIGQLVAEKWSEQRRLIRDAMASRGVSQAGLCRTYKVNPTGFSSWLKTGVGVSPAKIERLLSWAMGSVNEKALAPAAPPSVPTESPVPTTAVSRFSPEVVERQEASVVASDRVPAEFILLSLLEECAQRELEGIAGELAEHVSVRVILEWRR